VLLRFVRAAGRRSAQQEILEFAQRKRRRCSRKQKPAQQMIAQSGPKRISYEQRRNVEATGQGSDGEGKKRKEKKRKGSHGNRVRLKRTKTIPVRASGEGEKEP
jgi:hypothetical protein